MLLVTGTATIFMIEGDENVLHPYLKALFTVTQLERAEVRTSFSYTNPPRMT